MPRFVVLRQPLAVAAAVVACILAGCNRGPATPAPQAQHDHDHDHDHDHAGGDHASPATLSAGVTELRRLAAEVKDRLASGNQTAADDAVHGLGRLLEDVQDLVKTSTLSASAQTAASRAVEDLFSCFDELDVALHAKPGAGTSPADVHASLAGKIDAAIAALAGAAGPAPAATSRPAVTGDDEAMSIIREAQERKRKED